MTELRFSKYHGTGNDFVMIEDLAGEVDLTPALVAALCDRRFGVGGDGLIRVAGQAVADMSGVRYDAADVFMDYYNADGQTAEMCGNGVRCLAKLAYERGYTEKRELVVATRGGNKLVWLEVAGGFVERVTVDMGPPAFEPPDIPMTGPTSERYLGEPFEWDGTAYKASAVSMGNPHLVLFVNEDPEAVDVARIGPQLEHHEWFPRKTNVEFVAATPGGLKVRVWERGVGETLACGTGACASLVAANHAGLVPRKADVRFPGGVLEVEWREDDSVYLTGPAEHVFDGVVDTEELLRGVGR